VCLLVGLLPTTALATPATVEISSYAELLAAEENSYTGIIIHGDEFNGTWPEDETTAVFQNVGSVSVTGNWVIPQNVTLDNYKKISLTEGSTVTVNGTWANHGTGSGISGGTVVVNGTFVSGNGDDENVVVNPGGVLDLSSFYETFGNLTLEEGAEVQGDILFYLYGTLTAHGQTLQNKICVTKAGAQAALAGEMTLGEVRVGTSLPVSSASLTVAEGSTVSAGLVWCIEGSLTVAGQLDCENLYCSMNSTLVSASRIQVDGGLTVAQQVKFFGPGGTIDLGSSGELAIKGSDASAAGSYGIFDDDNTGHITGSGTVKLYDIQSEDSVYIPELFGYDSDSFVENRDLLTDKIAETVTIWYSWTHTWDEGVVTKAPTCTEPGEITYTCDDCGAAKTKVVPAAGHNYDENGVCTVCGEGGEAPDGDVVLYVGGVDMVKSGTADGAVYDAASNTLTLTNATILDYHAAGGTDDSVSAVRAGIYYQGGTPLKLVLTGESTIVLYPSRDGDAESGSYIAAAGIYADGSVDVESDSGGSLAFGSGTITEDDAIFDTKEQEAYVYAQSIHVTDSLTVGGSANVNGRLAAFQFEPAVELDDWTYNSASNAAPVQVYAGDTLHVTGAAAFRAGSAQADGVTLVDGSGDAQITTLKGGSAQVEAGNLASGTVTAENVTVSGGTAVINSLNATGDIVLSGGTLTTNQLSAADLNVTGGTLTAEASSSNTSLKGVVELSGDANISGGTVTAEGGIQSAYETGSFVSTTGSFSLSGDGSVTAHGDGVRFGGVVSVSGNAKLTVTDVSGSAITGYQGVTIADNAVVNAAGPFAGIQVGSYNASGVFRMTGGTLTATAASTDYEYPCNMALYVMTGSVEFSGGHAELTGNPGCGIFFAAADQAELGDFSVTGGYLKVAGTRGGVIWQGGSGLPAVTRNVTVKTDPAELQYLEGSREYTSSGYDFTAYAATYTGSDVAELVIDPDLNGWPTNGLTTIVFGVEPCAEHSWDEGEVTKEATCTQPGEMTYTCADCGETKTEEMPALGHDWSTTDCEEEAACSRCDETRPSGEHTWGEDGICTVCGAVAGSVTPGDVVLYVDGVDMVNGGTVEGASYDAASNTLTLNGAAITNYYTIPLTDSATDPRAGIYYKGENALNIVVSGFSTISVVPGAAVTTYYSTAIPAFGIYADGPVNVRLDSSLLIQPGTADGAEYDEKAGTGAKVLGGAVYAAGDMTVAGSYMLRYPDFGTFQYTSTSGLSNAENHQMPFQVDGDLTVSNGPNLQGGELKVGGDASIAGKLDLTAAVGGYQKDSASSFIYCADATLDVGGTLDLTAGSVTIGSGCTRSGYAGLKAGTLRQSGGTLTLNNDENNYYAIQCDDLVQTGGTLTANHVVKAASSVRLSGGALTAASLPAADITVEGTANVTLSGVMGGLDADITISGGTVNITSEDYGIKTGDLTVTGGTTTVTAPVALSFSNVLQYECGNFSITGGTLKLIAEGELYGSTIAIRWDDVSDRATDSTHLEPNVTVSVTPSGAKFLETVQTFNDVALYAATYVAEDVDEIIVSGGYASNGLTAITFGAEPCEEHTWSDWTVTKEATCTEAGVEKRTCTNCGTTETRNTEALGHSYTSTVTAPTCTEQGYTTYTCSRCGDSYVDAYTDALDHDYKSVVTAPTCTEQGYTTYTCSRCGDSYKDDYVNALSHNYVAVVTDPTCTEQGYTTYTCSRCGDSYVDTYTDALGHDWGEWVVDKEATGTADGSRHRVCTRCGAVETETISMLQKQAVSWFPAGPITWTYGQVNGVQNTAYNDTLGGGALTYSSSDTSVATVDANGKAAIVGAGTATITATAAAVPGQYAETSASYTLVINKAPLTVTAKDAAITYGQVPANSGWTASGFAYDDDENDVTGTASYAYTYEQYGKVGTYAISVSGLTAKNYDITFAPGTLTVSKATEYTITLGNLAQRDDGITGVTAAIAPQDATAQIKVEYFVDGTWTTSLPTAAGEYQVRASLTSSDNIQTDSAYTYGTLTVERTIVVDNTDVSVTVEDGKAEIIVTEDELADIVANADGDVSVNLGGVENVDELVLPGSLLEALSESDKADSLTIATEDASISMSGGVLDTVAGAVTSGKDTVAVKLTAVEEENLNELQQAALDSITQDAVIVEVSLVITHTDGTTTELHELGGNVEVTVPFTGAVPEGKYIVVCYLSDDGSVTYVRATYDAVTQQVTFNTNHFSNYALFVSGDPAVIVNGGSGSGLYAVGATVTIKADSKSGYTFAGWKVVSGDITLTDANAAETTFTMPAGAVELAATYTQNSSGGGSGGGGGSSTYTLTFETNGGSKIASVSKSSGAAIDLTGYVPTRAGYDFDGWYADAKLRDKITSVKLTKNMTVYAKWTEKSGEKSFADVAGDAYYADAVTWAVDKGITAGTTATTFSPDAACTRAQAVTFLWRAAGSPAPKSDANPFTDVKADAYYYDAVLWAVENGITAGTTAATFSPDATCTRAQIVTFLWRAQKAPAAGG